MATVHGPPRPSHSFVPRKQFSSSSLTAAEYGFPTDYISSPEGWQDQIPLDMGTHTTSSGRAGASFSDFTPQQNTSAVKPSPSHGALIAARKASSHGKLHKRAGSASSVVSSPPLADLRPLTNPTLDPSPQPYIPDDYTSLSVTSPTLPDSTASKSKTKIRPFVRKLTSREDTSLDLSQSAYDLDGQDLYIVDPEAASRSAADVTFSSRGRKGPSHTRSTSGVSQLSTGTSASAQRGYVHPMRQTPRPYTPPLTQSYANSTLASEHSGEGAGQGSEEEQQLRQIVRDAGQMRGGYKHVESAPPPGPLRIQTDLSSSRLLLGSQSNLAGTPTSHRLRADTWSPAEPSPSISRSSLEHALRIRSKEPLDPASRAASIRAARQAFTEKEMAKAQKAEHEELKAAERDSRKREKRDASRRRRSDAIDRSKRSLSTSNEKVETLAAREYSSMEPAQAASIRAGANPSLEQPRRSTTTGTAKSSAQTSWVGFMVWLKTRFLKLGRKMRGKR